MGESLDCIKQKALVAGQCFFICSKKTANYWEEFFVWNC